MRNLVRRPEHTSALASGSQNLYATIQNIGATADNTAAIAASTAGIEQAMAANAMYAAEAAQYGAETVYELSRANITLGQIEQLQNLQLQTAQIANLELRSVGSALCVLGTTVAELGTDLKEIGREANALHQQTNDILGQSLGVQAEMLKTIRAEHARLEQDRKAKRIIYELEQLLDQIKVEPSPLVRAFAASLMLHQTGASTFSVNDIFEVSDKRLLNRLRADLQAVVDNVDAEAKAELLKFDEQCRQYFAELALGQNLERNVAPPKKVSPLLPDIALDDDILPPFIGERAMDTDLATKLNATLASLSIKRGKAFYQRIVVGGVGAVLILLSFVLTFAAPAAGLVLVLLFSVAVAVLLGPIGLRLASSLTETNIDPTTELNFLSSLGTTEERAAQALKEWAEYLRSVQSVRKEVAREAARARQHNEQMRKKNAEARAWNQRRDEQLKALRAHHEAALDELRQSIQGFLARYPSLGKWWTMPESPSTSTS